MYPDPDSLKKAQDSIQANLENFEKKLWVPSREEVIAARERAEALAAGADSTQLSETPKTSRTRASARSTKRSTKEKKPKAPKVSTKNSSSSSATRSVRRRK